jgi:hypothetical protein
MRKRTIKLWRLDEDGRILFVGTTVMRTREDPLGTEAGTGSIAWRAYEGLNMMAGRLVYEARVAACLDGKSGLEQLSRAPSSPGNVVVVGNGAVPMLSFRAAQCRRWAAGPPRNVGPANQLWYTRAWRSKPSLRHSWSSAPTMVGA